MANLFDPHFRRGGGRADPAPVRRDRLDGRLARTNELGASLYEFEPRSGDIRTLYITPIGAELEMLDRRPPGRPSLRTCRAGWRESRRG